MQTQALGLSAVSDAIATAPSDSAITAEVDRRRNFPITSQLSSLYRPI